MSTTQLTPAQHAILAKAINSSGGKIEWFPDNIKGGARTKVLAGMFNRALITPDGQDGKSWRVAAEGYDALGMPRPGSERRIGSFELGVAGSGDFVAADANQDRHRGFGELDGEGVGGWLVHGSSFRRG